MCGSIVLRSTLHTIPTIPVDGRQKGSWTRVDNFSFSPSLGHNRQGSHESPHLRLAEYVSIGTRGFWVASGILFFLCGTSIA
jgi:hypothetical protein